MTVPSRLDRRAYATAPKATPCPAAFPDEPSTRCEGVEGHAGPHVARVTVTWEDPPPATVATMEPDDAPR